MMILGALLGLVLGACIIVVMRMAVPSLFPEQGGLRSDFYVGLLPSNPDGTFGRRDYWRMAGFSLAGSAACFGIAAGGAFLSERVHADGLARIVEGAWFGLVLLMLLAIAAAFQFAWRAIRWRPRHLASEWSPPDDGPDAPAE